MGRDLSRSSGGPMEANFILGNFGQDRELAGCFPSQLMHRGGGIAAVHIFVLGSTVVAPSFMTAERTCVAKVLTLLEHLGWSIIFS